MRLAAFLVLAATAAAFQTPDSQTATFHAGTRLVEVEVVVRNKNGPVTNLTKDDFIILDQGRQQRIDLFRAGPSESNIQAIPAPPGAVSNRGAPDSNVSAGYTAVLFDQLNTTLEFRDYERKALVQFIRHMDSHERVAIYVLGEQLHVLQEFTDDPAKLIAALQHVDSGRDLMPANVHDAMFGFNTDAEGNVITGYKMPAGLKAQIAGSTAESAANVAQVYRIRSGITTMQALAIIARHLAGMPGRRNLVWLTEDWKTAAPAVPMLLQSRIALYPVLARSLDYNPFNQDFTHVNAGPLQTLFPDVMEFQRKDRELGELTGGEGFGDATDIGLAVKRAEEDSRSAYTLGYYPAEADLDGTYHLLTVKVAGKGNANLQVRYRPGYVATRQVLAPLPPQNAIADIFQNPLDDSEVGITAQCEPDSTPGLYRVRLTLDLHDLHLVHEAGHSRGGIQLGFLSGTTVRVRAVAIDVSDDELAVALRDGYQLRASGVPATGNQIRLMARDPVTGVVGSLTIPLPATTAAHTR